MGKNAELPARANATRAVKEIVSMSAGKAEKALEAIADRDRDELAKDIQTHLSSIKVAAILRQHDFSGPSIISWIITPELIASVSDKPNEGAYFAMILTQTRLSGNQAILGGWFQTDRRVALWF
jgi:hypothetical protein